MPTPEFLQLIVVAALAGYVGYLLGRASAKASTGGHVGDASPTPGPITGPEPPPRRSSAPPPAGAGSDRGTPGSHPPRRSSSPPPAAAGLMQRDE